MKKIVTQKKLDKPSYWRKRHYRFYNRTICGVISVEHDTKITNKQSEVTCKLCKKKLGML